MPVYEKILDTGKGPQLYTPNTPLVAPDILAFRGNGALWIEAKTKTVFSWYGIGKRWVTGIDLHHYRQYLQVAQISPWPVWMLFLHTSPVADSRDVNKWGAPKECPVGLFGGKLSFLSEKENISHEHPNWGKTGMIYWAHETLTKIAPLEEVIAVESELVAA